MRHHDPSRLGTAVLVVFAAYWLSLSLAAWRGILGSLLEAQPILIWLAPGLAAVYFLDVGTGAVKRLLRRKKEKR